MSSTFFKVLFISLYVIILAVNIFFCFNLTNVMNPTSLNLDYSQYYFGINSFIESFKSYFRNSSFLNGYLEFLKNFGAKISSIYTTYVTPLKAGVQKINIVIDIIQLVTGILLFANNLINLILLVFYGLCYVIFVLCFLFEIILFAMSLFGGAFATKLPNEYPELNQPISQLAMMV